MSAQNPWLRRALSGPRWLWRWLTSMRTALVLLFLLALGAIPGALLPQRSLNADKVDEYIANNGRVGEIYDKLQLYDVFSSVWFTAIYVLLFVSLIGCILPRSWEHYRAMKTPPVRAPKNMERLPLHASGIVDCAVDEVVQPSMLKGWRVARYTPEEDRAGATSLSAEKGYIREFFNLVFHLGLVGILVAVGLGRMLYYEGQVVVVAGTENSQFCNTAVANYDSFRFGALFDGGKLKPFCVKVEDFSADYLPNGQAKMFTSDVRWAEGGQVFTDANEWEQYRLRVNHPLRIAGDRVYLQGHGYAPRFTVTWPNGESRTQMVQFRPDDPTFFLSSGVLRFDPPAGMYSDLFERRQKQLAIQGLFAPTAEFSGGEGDIMSSSFPAMRNPGVAIDVYRGNAGLDDGRGQSIYSLDPRLAHSGELQKIERVNLMEGESVTLDDGTVVRFDGANEFANLQVSHDPAQVWVLVAAVVTLIGLVGSVSVKRRRVWVRMQPDPAGGTAVSIGGLARTDRAGWGAEFERIQRAILRLPEESSEESEEDDEEDND